MTSTQNSWPVEQEYLDYLKAERQLYAWCLQEYGGQSPEQAWQEAESFYAYQPVTEPYRGLVFHDGAWHWAMLEIFGSHYWLNHPKFALPSKEYHRRVDSYHKG